MTTTLLLVIDPNAAQTQVLAWIGVATVVAGALSGFIGVVLGYIAKIRSDIAIKKGESDHATSSANIASLQTSVVDLALKTPPPMNSEPMPVTVTNSNSDPVPTKEATQTPPKA